MTQTLPAQSVSHITLAKTIPERRQPFRLPAGFYSFLFIFTFVLLLLIKPNPAYAVWTDGQAADVVLGQPDFTSNGGGTTASTMRIPRSVCIDPSSYEVFVVDYYNSRVLRFSATGALVNGSAAEGVLGQADFTSGAANCGDSATANTMCFPTDCVVDSGGRLWVVDKANDRVLRFDSAVSKTNGADADGVLGQANFTSGDANRGATDPAAYTMNSPTGLYEKSGRLWVADTYNSRVLRFDSAASKSNGASADGVLGQSDFVSSWTTPITDSIMNSPQDVVEDSNGSLFVSDLEYERVLRFDSAASKSNGANANGVLGQSNFTSTGNGTTASTLFGPIGVAIDGSNGLYVFDTANKRILIFNSASGKSDGAAADNVLGQPDFTSNGGDVTASTFWAGSATGWFDSNKGRLWVADGSNSRVLSYLNADLIIAAIPTMSEWAMLIFIILTGMIAVYYLKKNEQ